MIVDIKTDLYATHILNNQQGLVLLDFGTTTCAPCKSLAQILEAIDQSHPKITIAKINVDDNPELAIQFGIMSVPTLVFWKNNAALQKVTGLKSRDFIENLIAQHL